MNKPATESSKQLIWQVEVSGQIYEANFDELVQWIDEGALQPDDKVRRGNLSWRDANKIPALSDFFKVKRADLPPTGNFVSADENVKSSFLNDVVNDAPSELAADKNCQTDKSTNNTQQQKFHIRNTQNNLAETTNSCVLHPENEAVFVCSQCAKKFCQSCPKSFGGSVKICPSCGEMCQAIDEIQSEQNKSFQYRQDLSEGFGFADFGRAIVYPFKFKISLLFGALLFMFFTLGQNAWAMGGAFLIVAAIFCRMLANTLTFGILANTVENFSQGKTNLNFMPLFEDFDLWEDVIHPFFLSVGAYLVSFGLLFAVIIGGMYSALKTESPNPAQTLVSIKSLQTNSNRQTPQGAMTVEEAQAEKADDAKKIENLESAIKQTQTEQSTSNETKLKPDKVFSNVFGHGKFFIIILFAASIWGIFYFPAACLVAGYTRSLTATLNPSVGIDTIKRLGFDYVKILLFCFLLLILGAAISYLLNAILSPFNLPQLGNLPAKAVESLAVFYLSAVFSVTLGYAVYKNSAKMNLTNS